MDSEGIIQIIDSVKRAGLSLAVVVLAAYMTMNASSLGVTDSNLGVWTGLAASVVMAYIGSKTTSQAIAGQ